MTLTKIYYGFSVVSPTTHFKIRLLVKVNKSEFNFSDVKIMQIRISKSTLNFFFTF